jgi:hypothetical protein
MELLERIESSVANSHHNPVILVLTGVGGQGKTQIALEYCRKSVATYHGIFWIDATSKVSAMRCFDRLAKLLGKPGQDFADSEEKLSFVKDTLRLWPEPWLLVFDNYDMPEMFSVSSFFPVAHGAGQSAILVTSRRLSAARLGSSIKVQGLTNEEALELLQSHSPQSDMSDEDVIEGRKIVQMLGHMALAIDQAAAYISVRQLPLRLFIDQYEKRKADLLKYTPVNEWEYKRETESDNEGGALNQNLSVFTTWEMSLDQMSSDYQNRQYIEDFLTQAAFLEFSSISETLFRIVIQDRDLVAPDWTSLFLHQGQWDSLKFEGVVEGLLNLSLIQSVQTTAKEVKFALHPLVKVRFKCLDIICATY